jgi:hypothetical protein
MANLPKERGVRDVGAAVHGQRLRERLVCLSVFGVCVCMWCTRVRVCVCVCVCVWCTRVRVCMCAYVFYLWIYAQLLCV